LNRFTRQIRLAEVGEGGQAKLSAARVALRTDGFARDVEEAYLRGAGVGVGPNASIGSDIFIGSDTFLVSSASEARAAGAPSSTTRAEIRARRDEEPGRAHDERDSRSPNAGKGSCDRGQNPGMGESDLGRCTSGASGVSGAGALGVRHPGAREVADGAYAALLAMREALGVGGAS
jgi:hypothetical protein